MRAGLAAEIIEKNINQNRLSDIDSVISYLFAGHYTKDVFLVSPKGKVLFVSKRKYIGKDINEILNIFNDSSFFKNKDYKYLKKNGTYIFIKKILFKENSLRPQDTGFLIIEYDYNKLRLDAIYPLFYSSLVFVLIIFITVFILNFFFKKYIADRIYLITSILEEISKGNLNVKIEVFGKDEIGIITRYISQVAEKLKEYVYYDYLTKVYNRYYFEKKIQKKIKEGKSFSLIMFDTDNFKAINDLFGHYIGDKILKAYAKRLKNLFENKGFVCRFGGDEFLAYLDGDCYKNDNELKDLVQEILNKMNEIYKIENYQIEITSTAGVSKFPEHGKTYTELLKVADIALYYGKEKGKSTVIIANEEIVNRNVRKAEIMSVIKFAIENEEFFLVYQPIFSTKDLKITGVEALLRWNNKELGFIYPDEFIPVLEESGYIKEGGEWILKQVLNHALKWEKEGIEDIKLNVNVDIQQILQSDFTDFVKNEILSKNFKDIKLGVEITEREAMELPNLIINKLETLKSSGVKISIDDFGTGYSSLIYLKLLPIDYLKIDKSFIDGIPNDPSSILLVETIINLAKDFNYKLIAEGVETKEQFEFLKSKGCDEIQGYYLSKPVSPEEIVKLYKKYNK